MFLMEDDDPEAHFCAKSGWLGEQELLKLELVSVREDGAGISFRTAVVCPEGADFVLLPTMLGQEIGCAENGVRRPECIYQIVSVAISAVNL